MGLEKDNIKDLFSSKLGNGFEPEVPASIWAGIDQLLPQQPVQAPDASSASSSSSSSTTTAASSATKVSVIKAVAVAAGVTAAVTTGVVLTQHDHPEHTTDPTPPVTQEHLVTDSLDIEEYMEDSIYSIVPVPRYEKTIIAQAEENPIIEEILEEVKEQPLVEEKKEEKKTEQPEDADITDNTAVEAPLANFSDGLSVGVIFNSNLLSGNTDQRGGLLLLSPSSHQSYLSDMEGADNMLYELKHKQPISVGVTLSKQITPRLSVETGLVYTYLSSSLKSSNNYLIDEEQTFHYLGIPVSLNYTFYQLKKTKFYVSVGGMMQKDIQGRYTGQINMLYSQPDGTGNGIIQNTKNGIMSLSSAKNKISQDNLQFSTRITLGASYPIYNKLYIFGTIGGAYYFDAGNKYRTIYSDQKTQLDLNLGLKFDF